MNDYSVRIFQNNVSGTETITNSPTKTTRAKVLDDFN